MTIRSVIRQMAAGDTNVGSGPGKRRAVIGDEKKTFAARLSAALSLET
jgi:hypothetical protein